MDIDTSSHVLCPAPIAPAMPLTFALQALLIRHEAYVADSERERSQMAATIEALEKEKAELEQQNVDTIKANRDLLNQLEQLNSAVASSDAHVRTLEDTLHSAEEEIERLSALAARTQMLEQQLIELEREQAALQGSLDLKIADERTAVQRWRRAEKTIGELQDQIDRIEAEARQERDRHDEIVSRMKRRMAVDSELAAAERAKGEGSQDGGPSVVSHFVKDILLDNANLQHGIVELREMLQNSNEEVERLREQLQVHQPLSPSSEIVPAPSSLQKELGGEPLVKQAVHIHHHYHTNPPKKDVTKPQLQKRVRKPRYNRTPGRPTIPSSPSISSTILSQTAVTVPPNTQRWSNATTLTPSSAPGSPLSTSHRGSIIERVFSDVAYDSSRPTSPSDSVVSPINDPRTLGQDRNDEAHRNQKSLAQSLKPPSLSTIRSASSPISLTTKSSPATAIISAASPPDSLSNEVFLLSPSLHSVIHEEPEEDAILTQSLHPATSNPNLKWETGATPIVPTMPNLRRAASHESMISVSGMDIHTLQSRPSQALFSSSPHFGSPSGTSSDPILTPWTATATPVMSGRKTDGGASSRSLLYGTLVNQKRGTAARTPTSSNTGLGKKVGGWVFGKWGATPAISSSRTKPSPARASSDQIGQGAVGGAAERSGNPPVAGSLDGSTTSKPTSVPIRLRPPGINQSGPLLGFFDAIPPTPTKVVVTDLDADALGEALQES
ncbi:hypothetical protein M011DRAFT_464310 [Sporormia fimetaria CBS 119925]|uniref:Uncharacterized protein n=1 Tax=Sporormia fimetaria CBS 119925 TaxID=1340428 RepID=A0A6A6VQU2_9PLEO|nr:hypothetical protein M011DRAFT_464310 [Sporormia fimetaria CBS 119925]